MEYKCPFCGNKVTSSDYCYNCHRNVAWVKVCERKSNLYLVEGYKMARCRELTLARTYLAKAIMLDKYNIEARNLLGLVYYETGEVGQALKQWIISHSLKKEDNKAEQYMKDVQKKPDLLNEYKEAIALYNKSLGYLEQQNLDVAIIRLKKAISLNSHFVKARTLLALCYMQTKQYRKADEQVKETLNIDKGCVEALRYAARLESKDTHTVEPYEVKYQPQGVSGGKTGKLMERSSVFKQSVMYFILGACSCLVAYTYLFLPSRVANYKEKISTLTQSEETLASQVQHLTSDYATKTAKMQEAQKKLEADTKAYETKLNSYEQKEKLASTEKLLKEGKNLEAAQQLYNTAGSHLDETDSQLYEQLKADVYPRANEMLYNDALSLYNKGDFNGSVMQLQTILLYEPEERMARRTLYYLGCNEEQMGNKEEAKKYFQKVTANYEKSYEARLASQRLETIDEE